MLFRSEPRNDVERMLVAMFEELLGVQGVGVQDSFFDLGGHSLIAVRLFAQIRKAWNVDFPISVLFEAPTIRKVAALIAERGVSDDGETGSAEGDDAPAKPERRFTHLVPMHTGEGGSKTPFFLVAGMFGNVLNLRHLAHLIGHAAGGAGLTHRFAHPVHTPHFLHLLNAFGRSKADRQGCQCLHETHWGISLFSKQLAP